MVRTKHNLVNYQFKQKAYNYKGNISNDEVFSRLNSVIPNITLNDLRNKILAKKRQANKEPLRDFKLLYDVYLPNKVFKKSNPGRPIYQVFTSNEQSESFKWPSLRDFILNDSNFLLDTSADSPSFLYAFVDNGEALFYSFKCDEILPKVY